MIVKEGLGRNSLDFTNVFLVISCFNKIIFEDYHYNLTLNMHINTTTDLFLPTNHHVLLNKSPFFGDFSHLFTHLQRVLETLWFPPCAAPVADPKRPRFIKASAGRLGQKPMVLTNEKCIQNRPCQVVVEFLWRKNAFFCEGFEWCKNRQQLENKQIAQLLI